MPRRRGTSEPAFGSDSFLDVIANLVGIVLIIIVLVGARIRHLPDVQMPEPEPTVAHPLSSPQPLDTATEERAIRRYQAELVELQRRLLATLRSLDAVQRDASALQQEQMKLSQERNQAAEVLNRQQAETAVLQGELAQVAQLEKEQRPLRERLGQLQEAIKELEKRPQERKLLRYHLPVSRPLGAGELLFECRQGRVTFADLQAMLEEVRQVLPKKAEELANRWEATDTVGPIGAFKLQFTIARDRASALDQAFGALPPVNGQSFRYGLDSWELVPAWPNRGETIAEALKAGSRFLEVVDNSDPQLASLTFFVYPDSFEMYRTLRDYLYERGFVVAGRPLQSGATIAGSRKGTTSRGQ